MAITETAVRQTLDAVLDPLLAQSVTDLGMVQAARVARGGRVVVQLALPTPHWPARQELMDAVRQAIATLPGVADVTVQCAENAVWTPYRLAESLKAPLGLPQDEPASPTLPSAVVHGRARRLLQRLRQA